MMMNEGDEFKYGEFNESDETDDELEGKKSSNEFAKMFEDSMKKGARKRFNVGDKLNCEILVLGREDCYVATGSSSDGVVSRRDLQDESGNVPYKVGDRIDLFVTQVRGTEVRLSPKPSAKNIADDLEDAFDMMLPVEGRVAEVVNGGFRVSVHGKLAFCPISQMDVRRIEQPEEYIGKKFEFRITKFEEGGRNIVVSRRKQLDEERQLSVGNFASERKAGEVVKGKVARLEKFGAFIELMPGIDGLVHVSEIAWSRVNDPAEVLKVGQELDVKILKIESIEGKLRIGLSIKQAGGAAPWDTVGSGSDEIKAGSVVVGTVTRCVKFGAFVELKPGVEGLIPLSEMSYTKRVLRSDEIIKEGERVTVMIKDVDVAANRIALSLKDAGQDPWALVAQKYPVGHVLTGRLERREAYGLFVKLEDGIVGLLPKSKAAERPEFAFDKFKIGDDVTVQVAEIRREERRISLDVPKDPGADVWKGYVSHSGATGAGFGTLADKLKAAMDGKKKK